MAIAVEHRPGHGQFRRVAETVAARATELLCARIAVIDERGMIVAGSDPGEVGLPFDLTALAREPAQGYLRVPLHLDGQAGEVIVGEPHTGEAIPPRLTQAIVELTINQTTVVDRLPNGHEIKSKLIADLLRGSSGDEMTILRESRLLGMDLAPPRAVILIDAGGYAGPAGASAAQTRRRVQLLIGSIVGFFRLPNDTICAHLGDGEIAVLKASNTKNLSIWAAREDERDGSSPSWANLAALKRASDALLGRLRADTGAAITIGIGRYHPGIRGLALSYQDARTALSLGRRFQGQNRVHCLDGLGVAAFVGVADEQTKIDLARHLLSPLDHEPDLLGTLDAFFREHCQPSAAATALGIHRNTLGYRLDKISSLTGLNPRHFDEAVQIRLALVLRSLDRREEGPRG